MEPWCLDVERLAALDPRKLDCPQFVCAPFSLIGNAGSPQAISSLTPGSAVQIFDPILDSIEAVVLGDGGERYQEIVRILLGAGADRSIGDHDGVRPLEHAERLGFEALLRSATATWAIPPGSRLGWCGW